MGFFIALIEIVIGLFACWTVSYHLILVSRLPAEYVPLPFLTSFSVLVWAFFPKWKNCVLLRGPWKSWITSVFLISAVSGLLAVISLRPDADDIEYFHRAVVQLQAFDLPFFLNDTFHNVNGLASLSVLHLTTSYEPLMAFGAHLMGVDPVAFYQNGGAFVASALLPMVYVLLYMEFGLSRKVAVGCTVVMLIFLLLDGNIHRSFGNTSIVRFWQGKTIMWGLIVPTALLIGHRFLIAPDAKRFLVLVMIGFAGIGLSNSAVFMIPILFCGLSLAYLITYGCSKGKLARVIGLNAAGFYCISFAFAIKLGFLPMPDGLRWQWPEADWLSNLRLVFWSDSTLVRDVFVLLVLPLTVLPRVVRWFPIALTAVFILLFANPLSGEFWIKHLTPATYWRLAYLFPVPWCSGLIACVLTQHKAFASSRWIPCGVAGIFVFVCALAFVKPAWSPYSLKSPRDYNFPHEDLRFSQEIATKLNNRSLLAPVDLAVVLPLFNPTVRMETGRPEQTMHIFRTSGRESEGKRRCLSQTTLSDRNPSAKAQAAFLDSINKGVDAIIVRPHALASIGSLVANQKSEWIISHRTSEYVLLLRNRREPVPRSSSHLHIVPSTEPSQ